MCLYSLVIIYTRFTYSLPKSFLLYDKGVQTMSPFHFFPLYYFTERWFFNNTHPHTNDQNCFRIIQIHRVSTPTRLSIWTSEAFVLSPLTDKILIDKIVPLIHLYSSVFIFVFQCDIDKFDCPLYHIYVDLSM